MMMKVRATIPLMCCMLVPKGLQSKGSTWVKIDTRDGATWPFLSREFSTHCLLSSDRHFHKIQLSFETRLFGKKSKNDMQHFNINMMRHPTPQITYDVTHDRGSSSKQLGLVPQCINSTKIPSCCTMHVF